MYNFLVLLITIGIISTFKAHDMEVNLVLKVKVQGEPVTDKAWFWGRREIKSSASVAIETSDYASKITVRIYDGN